MTFAGFAPVTAAPAASLLPPDNRARVLGVDAELGAPEGALDISKRSATYLSRVSGTAFQVSSDAVNWTTVLDVPGASKGFGFSFDANMRPMVAYQLGDDATSPAQRAIYLYWYDNTVPGFVTLTLGAGVSPFLSFDYPVNSSAQGAECLLAYIRNGTVYYRRQTDRFTIEYTVGAMPAGRTRITGFGLARNWRLQIRCGR